MPDSTARKHGRIFYRVIRSRVRDRLAASGKVASNAEIDRLVDSVSDQDIDAYAEEAGLTGALGDGSLLQWIVAHKDAIMAVIKIIITIIMMFMEDPPAPPTV